MKQVGKRLLSLLLALCMMMSLCVSALAVNDVTVTATLDTPTLYKKSVAQTVKLRVATSEPITICDYQVKLKLPEGWTVTAMENDDSNAQLNPADYNLATGNVVWNGDGEDHSVTNFVIYTVEIPADTKAGSYELSLYDVEANAKYGAEPVLTSPDNDTSATLTIADDDNADNKRPYTVMLHTATTNLKAGDTTSTGTVQVSFMSIVQDVTTYSAYSLKLKYSKDILQYVQPAEIYNTYTIDNDEENGILTIHRFGKNLNAGYNSDGLMLVFRGKAAGTGTVELLEAYVDNGENATVQNAPRANVAGKHTFKVTGPYYKVTTNYPDEIDYAPEALANTDYSFKLKDGLNWKGLIFRYTIDGVLSDEMLYDATNKCYTIPASKVTGDIHIDGYNRNFDVTVEGNAKDEVTIINVSKPTYRVDYSFTLDKQEGWTYTVAVTVGGVDADYTVSEDGKTYTIAGKDIIGNIVITVNKTKGDSQISFGGDTSDLEGAVTRNAPVGKDFTFTIKKDANYDYTVGAKYTESGETIPVTDNGDGTYTIEGKYITGDDITITITKTAKWGWTVEVTEYVKVGEAKDSPAEGAQSVFLITAKLNDGVTLDDGSTLAYGDAFMYRNEAQYDGAYAYLLFSGKTLDEVKAEAETEGQISIQTGEAHTFNLTGDVNGTERIDINDAQLVYNMYNAKYTAFDANTTMEKFLAADLNGDRIITVDDAVAVVDKIK